MAPSRLSPDPSPPSAPARRRPKLQVVRGAHDPRAAFYDAMAEDLAARTPSVRAEAMRAIFGLVTSYDAVHHFVSPRIVAQGLSMAQFNILCVLSQEPRGVPVNDLSQRLLVTRQNLTAVVQGLEKRKLVRRVVDDGDRRIRRIVTTPAGDAVRDAILPEHLDRVCNIMRGFSAGELDQLASLLARVRAAVSP